MSDTRGRGSNTVIRKIYVERLFAVSCIEKSKSKKKRPRMAHFRKMSKFSKKLLSGFNLKKMSSTIHQIFWPLLHKNVPRGKNFKKSPNLATLAALKIHSEVYFLTYSSRSFHRYEMSC